MFDPKKRLQEFYGYTFDSVGVLHPRSRTVTLLEISPRFLVSVDVRGLVCVSDGVHERSVPFQDVVAVGDPDVSRLVSDYERSLKELDVLLNRLAEIEKKLREKNLVVLLPKDI